MNKRGFTILEVVISFLIISLMAACILVFMTNQLMLTGKTKSITESAFTEQKEMEKEIQKVEGLIKEKHDLESIIMNSVDQVEVEEARNKLRIVYSNLSSYENSKYNVFGKDISVYKLEIAVQGKGTPLTSWVADRERKEYPTPIVKNFEIHIKGENNKKYSIFTVGKPVVSEVTYEDKNKELLFTELYQWYISRDGFHMPLANDTGLDQIPEADIGTKYPSFPEDFEIIPCERGCTLSQIIPEYEGKFLVCTITPATRQGKMGAVKPSNYLYISKLPSLNNNYEMVIDASFINQGPGNHKIHFIDSILGKGAKLKGISPEEKKIPVLKGDGVITGRFSKGNNTPKHDIYSKCVSFDCTNAMRLQGIHITDKFSVFVVAKLNNANADGNQSVLNSISKYSYIGGNADGALKVGLDGVSVEQYDGEGQLKNTVLRNDTPLKGDWHVISFSVGEDISYKIDAGNKKQEKLPVDFSNTSITMQLGNDSAMNESDINMEFAEFIMYGSDDQSEFDKIHQYLLEKYGTDAQ